MCVCVCVCCVCVCVCVLTRPQTWYTPPFLSFGGYVTCLPDECKNGIKQNRRRQQTHTHAHVYVCVSCLKMRRLEKQRKINSSKRPLPTPPLPPTHANNELKLRGNNWWQEDVAQPGSVIDYSREEREREREYYIIIIIITTYYCDCCCCLCILNRC